jgi:hypothetical protein
MASASESNFIAALKLQDFARVGGCGDLEPEPFDDLADPCDLGGVRLGELALAEPQAVFQPDTDMPAAACAATGI